VIPAITAGRRLLSLIPFEVVSGEECVSDDIEGLISELDVVIELGIGGTV